MTADNIHNLMFIKLEYILYVGRRAKNFDYCFRDSGNLEYLS